MSDLIARIKLDDKGLDTQLKGVSSKFKTAATGIAAIAIPVAAIAGIARMVEGLAAIGERAIEAAGSLHDTAAQLGVTAERLQELRLIAKNAGVDVQGFDKSLSVLNRTLGQASLGQGQFEKIAKAAGLSLRDEQGHIKSTSVVWDDLTARIQSGALSQNQAIGLAAAAFGREGGKMVQVLRQTREEQQKVIDTARKFGAILSNELVRSADEYGDQLDLIKKGTEALGIQSDMMFAPLTLKWSLLKNEIAGATVALADFLGVIDGGTQLQERQLRQIEQTIAAHREYLEVTKHPNPMQDALLQKLTADWVTLKNSIDAAKKASAAENAAVVGGDVEGMDVDTEEEIKAAKLAADEKAKAAKAAADYELDLVTSVYAEKDRLALEEIELLAGYATLMTEERERLYGEELGQLQTWNEVLADERQRAADMEIDQFIQKEGLLTEARREGAEARVAFDKMAAGQQVATTIGALATITAAVAQHSKKAFELNKLAAIANAIVNTAQGATKALAQGGFAGIAMAAAVIGAGAVQIAAIKKTQFQGGGGGTTPSAVGTTAVVNGNPVSAGAGVGQSSVIRVEGINSGSLFTGKALRELMERIQEAQRDGGRLVIV